ncbi:hypothetical protein HLH33_00635 [Gluconacetobacter diazotrophicus]|uniref:Uncharacterized protein n=1 Tax=Gluconacetobacter diazotrophicus TaxID=33996 RepID=A0A7W4FBR9_GLUDI|nr:hypothetical protein [Gluconacetobacter diazotrophicus]MBB2154826.1 hypothetical protein [Gluconacetobacter diazotrophicus]
MSDPINTPTQAQIEAFIRQIPSVPAKSARRGATHISAAGVAVIEHDDLPTPYDYEQFSRAEDRFEDYPDPASEGDEMGDSDDNLPTAADREEFDRNEDRREQEDSVFADRRNQEDADYDERREAWAAGRDGGADMQNDQPESALDGLAARLNSVDARAAKRVEARETAPPDDDVRQRIRAAFGINPDGTRIEGPAPIEAALRARLEADRAERQAAESSRAESQQTQPEIQDSRQSPSVLEGLASRLQDVGHPQIARRQDRPEAAAQTQTREASALSAAPSAAQSAPAAHTKPNAGIPTYSSPAAFDAKIDAAVRARSNADIQAAVDRHRQNPSVIKDTSRKTTDEDRKTLAGMGRLELADAIAARGMALSASRREGLPDEVRATRQQVFERAVGESMARDRQQADVGKMWMRAATQAHMSGEKPTVLPDRQADSAALAKMTDKDLAREVGLRARAADIANATDSPDRAEVNAAFKAAADQVVSRAEAQVRELRAERVTGREATAAGEACAGEARRGAGRAGSPLCDAMDAAKERAAANPPVANVRESEMRQK